MLHKKSEAPVAKWLYLKMGKLIILFYGIKKTNHCVANLGHKEKPLVFLVLLSW